MTRYILGVDYDRQPLPSAYIRVVGQTKKLALQRTKRLGSVLKKALPEAALCAPNDKGQGEDGLYAYEAILSIGLCIEEAKAVISEIVLKGSV